MDEVRKLGELEGADLRNAKEVLAFEATKLCHGESAAKEAQSAAKAAFSGAGDLSSVPSTQIELACLQAGISLTELLVQSGLADSKGAARRLIEQGGAYLNNEAMREVNFVVNAAHLQDGALLLRAGKKKFHRVVAT